MNVKKVSSQSIIGQLGANLIERYVLLMKNVWRPIQIFDVGVDGEIEICDPITGEATNTIIRVQAKATTQPFQAETATSFEYTCQQRDIDYWLRGNAPVILIVCRPRTEEAYWISIKDYFQDLSTLKTRKICFDKKRDRFDEKSDLALRKYAMPRDSGVYFSPLQKHEKLFTNLLEVLFFSTKLYLADTNFRKYEDLWAFFKSKGVNISSEWILKEKRILSFFNLSEPPFNMVCDLGTVEEFGTDEWSETDEEDKKRDFVHLLNNCLRERTRCQGLWFDRDEDYYFIPPTRGLKTRKMPYRSLKHHVSREVFKQYSKKSDANEPAFCRHSAFKGYFVRFNKKWYLEITPTYRFTSNGIKTDLFAVERLKGIKRLERNPAVLGHLLMWADFLSQPIQTLFASEYPFLRFGQLTTAHIMTGIPDDIWYQAEEGNESQTMNASENQPGLWGL